MVILHIVSLPDITYDPGVKSLAQEFKRTYSESVSRLQVVKFLLEKHFVKSTALVYIKVKVSKHYRSTNFIIVNLKMLVTNFVAIQLSKVSLLASFLVWITFSENNWHLLSVENDLCSLETAFNEVHDQFVFGSYILLEINFTNALHQVNQVHKSINLFLFQTDLFKVSLSSLLNHLLQCLYLFTFEILNAHVEVIGLEP